jgi:molecular chaperone GrpE
MKDKKINTQVSSDQISKIKSSINTHLKKPKKEEIKKDSPKEKDDFKDKYLRLLAEFENSRKRMQKEKTQNMKFAIENIVLDILPILDNFENAIKFSKNSSEEVKNWATGFEMIHSQFKDILHSHGIVAFHSKGNIFDPHFHEAMEIIETSQHPDGTILEEFAKGYKNENRIIRPAKVKISKKIKIKKGNDHEQKN